MRAALCQLDRGAIARRVMGRCEARAHVFLALGAGQTLWACCAGGAALPGGDLLLRERLGGHGGSGRVGSNDDGAWGDWPRARLPPWAKGLRSACSTATFRHPRDNFRPPKNTALQRDTLTLSLFSFDHSLIADRPPAVRAVSPQKDSKRAGRDIEAWDGGRVTNPPHSTRAPTRAYRV